MSDPTHTLRGRLFAGLAALVAIAVVPAVVVALTARGVVAHVESAEIAHRAAADASSLERLGRDVYIAVTHRALLPDVRHAANVDDLLREIDASAAKLALAVDGTERARLDSVVRGSRTLATTYAEDLARAVGANDAKAIHDAEHVGEFIVAAMTRDAAAVATSFEDRSGAAARVAVAEARRLVVLSLVAAAAVAIVAIVVAERVFRDVARPLVALRAVAERVARGDRVARVQRFAARELDAAGDAFNRMLDAVRVAEARLVEQSRLAAVGRIAAGVAHEINNPIAVIRGYVATILEGDLPAGLAEEIRIVDDEAARCQRIAEDLLASAKDPILRRGHVRARTIVEEAIAAERRIGNCAREVLVDTVDADANWDAQRIRQLVANLLRNASQASRAIVEVSSRLEGDAYVLRVDDDGPGIADEAKADVFEPFFTTRPNGTGLGLAVSLAIARAHGGTIDVGRSPLGGASFTVRLPLDGGAA